MSALTLIAFLRFGSTAVICSFSAFLTANRAAISVLLKGKPILSAVWKNPSKSLQHECWPDHRQPGARTPAGCRLHGLGNWEGLQGPRDQRRQGPRQAPRL